MAARARRDGTLVNTSLAQDVRPLEVWAWAMYDFANSGYTTVVITAVFNAYFVSVVARNEEWATLAWTAALAVSYLLIMLTAPLIGAWADAHAAKKRLLLITTIGFPRQEPTGPRSVLKERGYLTYNILKAVVSVA